MIRTRHRRPAPLLHSALAVALLASTPAAAQQPADEAPAAVELPEVVARVNGVEITRDDVLEHAAATRARMAQLGEELPPEDLDFYREVVDQLIGSQLLYEAAVAADLAPSDEVVAERIGGVKEQVGSPEAFRERLAAQGTSEEVIAQDLRYNMAIQSLVESEIAPGVTVGEEEIRALYESRADELQRPEQLKLRHILVRVPEDAEPAAIAAARERADAVVARIEAGEEFAEVARESSDDPGSAEEGGALPWLGRGNTVPAFEEAAFALAEPGDTSGVVRSRFGFHVIRLDDRRPAGTIPFEEVEPQLHAHLKDQAVGRAMEERVEELRGAAEIEVFI